MRRSVKKSLDRYIVLFPERGHPVTNNNAERVDSRFVLEKDR